MSSFVFRAMPYHLSGDTEYTIQPNYQHYITLAWYRINTTLYIHECWIHEHSTYLRGPWLDKGETRKDCHQWHLGCSWIKHLCYGWDNTTHVRAHQVLGDDVCIIPWRLWIRQRIVSDWKDGWMRHVYLYQITKNVSTFKSLDMKTQQKRAAEGFKAWWQHDRWWMTFTGNGYTS